MRRRDVACWPGADIGRMLFDHFVSALQDRLRNSETERLGGLQVNSKLEYRWLLDRQIPGLRTTENPVNVSRGLAEKLLVTRAVGPPNRSRPCWRPARSAATDNSARRANRFIASPKSSAAIVSDRIHASDYRLYAPLPHAVRGNPAIRFQCRRRSSGKVGWHLSETHLESTV